MKVLATQRHILPVLIFSGMKLVLPLPVGAAADELSPENEAAPLADANRIRYAEIRELHGILVEQEMRVQVDEANGR